MLKESELPPMDAEPQPEDVESEGHWDSPELDQDRHDRRAQEEFDDSLRERGY